MDTVLNIVTFVAALLLLIGIHEFAHLLAGKWAKIPVERFSIGFGPAIVKWTIGETVYQLSVIPLGGFVKFKGEDFDDPEGFFAFPFGRKTAATVAGIVANLLLAVIIYFIIGLGWGVESPPALLDFQDGSRFQKAGFVVGDKVLQIDGHNIKDFYGLADFLPNADTLQVTVTRSDGSHRLKLPPSDEVDVGMLAEPVIGRIIPKSPAEKAGLVRGDRVIAINGNEVASWNGLVSTISEAQEGTPFALTWVSGSDTITDTLRSAKMQLTGSVGIGVVVAIPTRPLTFGEALWLPVARTWQVATQLLGTIGKIIVGKVSARNLAGPVGIYQLTAQSRSLGLDSLLALLAMLSISLAILNILPIPMFDGGRIILFLVEKISGKRLGKKVWTVATYIGLAMIGALVILVFYNDISRIITGG